MNHLNLTVDDVGSSQAFLEKYFGLRTEHTRGSAFAVLRDDGGLVLTLMKGTKVNYPKTFHIGFIQDSEERVNEINRQLNEDGYPVEPPTRAHGWTFYVEAPGGFTVEVLY